MINSCIQKEREAETARKKQSKVVWKASVGMTDKDTKVYEVKEGSFAQDWAVSGQPDDFASQIWFFLISEDPAQLQLEGRGK